MHFNMETSQSGWPGCCWSPHRPLSFIMDIKEDVSIRQIVNK